MSITIDIDIETASRLPQGWAPWVGSPGLDPQALHTYPGSLLAVGHSGAPFKLHPRFINSCMKVLPPPLLQNTRSAACAQKDRGESCMFIPDGRLCIST